MSRRILPRCGGRVLGLLGLIGLLALSGCRTLGIGGGEPPPPPPPPQADAADVLGSGSVRVALLLPRSGAGNAGATATAFRNAADLALRDFPGAGIQVAVYDTGGTPAGAQAAVATALSEGVELVLGPVFSPEVAAAAQSARAAGAPVVAFSSDAAVAGPGVYLLSFLPADDVGRIVAYAAGEGRKSYAALLPANAYGSVAEAAFRRAAAVTGGRIVAIQTYEPGGADLAAKTAAIVGVASQVDALFLPDPVAAPAVGAALTAAGISRDKLKLLGSGQWDEPSILENPALVGSWYPAPTKQGFEEFSRRYQAAFGSPPPRNATLAYDATVLAAGLVRQFGADRFQNTVLANPNGFRGVDGVFRFTPNGLTERRLAVYEATGSGARMVAPAAASFAGGA